MCWNRAGSDAVTFDHRINESLKYASQTWYPNRLSLPVLVIPSRFRKATASLRKVSLSRLVHG